MVQFKEGTTSDIPLIRQLSHTIWPLVYGSILSEDEMDYMLNRMYSESSLLDQMNRLLHHFILVGISYCTFRGQRYRQRLLYERLCDAKNNRAGVTSFFIPVKPHDTKSLHNRQQRFYFLLIGFEFCLL